MNIIDMNFEQLIELIETKRYLDYYMPLLKKYIENSLEVQRFYLLNEAVLSLYCKVSPFEYFDQYDIEMDVLHNELDYYVTSDEPDPVLPYIMNNYVQLYMYLYYKKLVSGPDCYDWSISKFKIVSNKVMYLEELLKKHEFISIMYIILAINYHLNNADEKSVADMTTDECVYFIELHTEDAERYEDIIDAIIKINTNNPYIQQEKEAALVYAYFSKENYARALLHATNVNKKSRTVKAIFISNAMTGNIDGFFEAVKESGITLDEFTLYYPIILLAQHADRNQYGGTYTGVAEYIEQRIESAINNNEFKWKSIQGREIDTRDSNYYYLSIFEYATTWIEEYRDCIQPQEATDIYGITMLNELKDKESLFRFADDELKSDLAATFSTTRNIDKIRIQSIYLKYLDKVFTQFPDDIAKFLVFMYRAGCGELIDQRAYLLVSANLGNTNPLVKKSLLTLLTVAYGDVCIRDNNEWKEKFAATFDEYGIKEEDLSKDAQRREIYDSLSVSGKYEYKAACIQYDALMGMDYGTNDAGMLSMAFYRIIENESNERIWRPISKELDFSRIEQLLSESIAALRASGNNRNIRGRWQKNIDILRDMSMNSRLNSESKSLMLGNLKVLFEELHEEYPLSQYMREILFDHLTEEGKIEFTNFRFDEWYSENTRNTFRNPPAHNKYLSLRTAIDGKNYAEAQLRILKYMLAQ